MFKQKKEHEKTVKYVTLNSSFDMYINFRDSIIFVLVQLNIS